MAPKEMSTQQLLLELQQSNDFFDELVNMIPVKLYIAGQSGDDYNPKYFKGQSKESKEARRAQNKQMKRLKLNPELAETTTETKRRLEEEQNNNSNNSKPFVPQIPSLLSGTNTPIAKESQKSSQSNIVSPITNNNNNKSRIEALREKLHAKLAEKRAQRPSDPLTISKRAARRAEKKKRQEEAIRKKKSSSSNAEDKSASNKRIKYTNTSTNDDPLSDLAQVDFGRLDGLNPISNSNYTETNKALRNLSKSKNLEKLLADAETKKQRLLELKKGNAEEKQKAANMEWGDTIKEASGIRIKDDPTKIKKALKRNLAKKQKSTKAWKARIEQTKQKMDEKQKIRNHNLNKRKVGGNIGANLSKKRITMEEDKTKDGNGKRKFNNRPGFEGRKQDFLNKKKDQ